MKNTTIPLIGVSCLLLVGCTSSFSKARQAINQAPDWYDARRDEIAGEGYPQLVDIPTIAPGAKPGKTLAASEERVAALGKEFAANARAELPPVGGAEIARVAGEIRQQFAGLDMESNFLTDAEIAAIRDSFDVPRVTQGLKGQR
ncbi:hypothetical protein [Hyphomonas johnsonii]|jgi:hypothetical protein|uniref:Putative lipoprotein n=1 Tax=Hyphomonas johnsonii MHS-2 TaxID=1280950 RepID=A0A059FUQ5_9PROT|nr:hypothetical protein [Hyphomonas johnsonii]KCZ94420.1 putative lipoprotein [Hyphomonas johnsonii MHS-2]